MRLALTLFTLWLTGFIVFAIVGAVRRRRAERDIAERRAAWRARGRRLRVRKFWTNAKQYARQDAGEEFGA